MSQVGSSLSKASWHCHATSRSRGQGNPGSPKTAHTCSTASLSRPWEAPGLWKAEGTQAGVLWTDLFQAPQTQAVSRVGLKYPQRSEKAEEGERVLGGRSLGPKGSWREDRDGEFLGGGEASRRVKVQDSYHSFHF